MSLLTVRDICQGDRCGKLTLIVNKKYWLCDDCNYKRLHDGKSKEDVYSERATRRKSERYLGSQNKSNERGNAGRNKNSKLDESIISKFVTKASKIPSVSSSKRYHCSDGQLVSQSDIKWKLSLAYDQIKQYRPPICEGTGRNDVPLSFSHTISQARCKELSKTELIWDVANIEIEGFEAPTSNPTAAHNIWESGSLEKKTQLLNFTRKLQYIKEHDPEQYRKLDFELKLIGYEYII